MHSRCHLRSFVAPDPGRSFGVAIECELPEPGADDQEQRAEHGPRREHRRRAAGEHQRRADRRKQETAVRHGSVRAKAAAAPQCEREPAGDQGDPPDAAVREAEGGEEQQAGEEGEQRRPPPVLDLRIGPQGEIEEHAHAARERQHREDEADEGGVDPKGLRDPRAHPSEDPALGAQREPGQHHSRLIVRLE